MAESKASKTDALVKAVLVFFISLLSFSIGTFVGKKFSDNQYKTAKLNGIHDENSERDPASTHSAETEGKTEAASDEQVAKAAEEFVNDEEGSKSINTKIESPHEEKHDVTTHQSTVNHDEDEGEAPVKREVATSHSESEKTPHGKVDKGVSHATANLASDKNPPSAEKPKAHTGPQTTLPSQVAKSPIGKFTVQIASFPTEDEAKRKVSEVRGFGFDSFFTSVNLNGKTWYRVNVGMFPTVAEGEKLMAELKEKAQVKTGFIQKMVQ